LIDTMSEHFTLTNCAQSICICNSCWNFNIWKFTDKWH